MKEHLKRYFQIFPRALPTLSVLCIIFLLYMADRDNCSNNEIYASIYPFFSNMISTLYNDGLLVFMDKLTWVFLILLLFIPPLFSHLKEFVTELCIRIKDISASYHPHANIDIPVIEEQDKQDKKNLEQEAKAELDIVKESACKNVSKDDKKEAAAEQRSVRTSLDERKNLISKIMELIETEEGVGDFKKDVKLSITNDPVSTIDKLLFQACYRIRRRRYIFVMIINDAPILYSMDRFYKYMRIMNDIDSERNNQRHAIRLIVIKRKDKSHTPSQIEDIFLPAIEKEILTIDTFDPEKNTFINHIGRED